MGVGEGVRGYGWSIACMWAGKGVTRFVALDLDFSYFHYYCYYYYSVTINIITVNTIIKSIRHRFIIFMIIMITAKSVIITINQR